MGSRPRRIFSTMQMRKSRRRSNCYRGLCKPSTSPRSACIARNASVSDKLEALKNLIPSQNGEIKAEQLFKETADYIVLLKTQVFILQKLIDYYAQPQQENQNAVL